MCTTDRYAKHPQHAYYKGIWGHAPSRKFLKISCQKSEFGGISATKITCHYNLIEVSS